MDMMRRFRVTLFYLASGMEGVPDKRDFGVFVAESKESALDMAMDLHFPDVSASEKPFIQGALSATEMR